MIFRGSSRSGAIRDEDLHAYADGVLDGSRRRRVEQHLAAHPADAERVTAYRHINAQLSDLGRPGRTDDLGEPLAALREDLREALVRQRQVRRAAGGALVSVFLLATASGTWMLTGGSSGGPAPMQIAAVDSAHPGPMAEGSVEISAATQDEITAWLSQQVEAQRFSAPDLNPAGFSLSGARVVTLPDGPLVQILYDDDRSTRLTFSISPSEVAPRGVGVDELADEQLAVYWRQGPLVYSLVGPLEHGDLAALAELIGGPPPSIQANAVEAGSASQPAPAPASAPSPGVVLIDSKAEPATAPASPASGAPAASGTENVKSPPAAIPEKIEEPKPL